MIRCAIAMEHIGSLTYSYPSATSLRSSTWKSTPSKGVRRRNPWRLGRGVGNPNGLVDGILDIRRCPGPRRGAAVARLHVLSNKPPLLHREPVPHGEAL